MAVESMRIVTGCKTPEQFVAVFHRFCDAKTCFIPSVDTRPIGSALAFSLRLADGTPMLRGTCVVKGAWKTNENEFNRPGVQLEIKKLTAESAVLYDQMLSQKTAVMSRNNGVVQPVPHVTTNQHVPAAKAIDLILNQGNAIKTPMKPPPLPDAAKRKVSKSSDDDNPTQPVVCTPVIDDSTKPTMQMPQLQMGSLSSTTRAPGSSIILPANPLADFDEAALDQMLGCTLGEDHEPGCDDDLAIPVVEPAPLPSAPIVSPIRQKTAPIPVVLRTDAVPIPIARGGTRPLALGGPPPASRSMFNLHAMTHDERFWLMCALGAGLLVAAIVLASAFVFGG